MTKVAVTIGNFDGVHRGHKALIQNILEFKEKHSSTGIEAWVVTFDPHPNLVLRPDAPFKQLASIDERVRRLKELGVDGVKIIPFTKDFATTPAKTFFRDVLIQDMDPAFIAVGHNFFFGHNREGTPGKLLDWSQEIGVEARVISPIQADSAEVSSSRIRSLLASGKVQAAARLLGRDFSLSSQVILGDQRGQSIGVPTANMSFPKIQCLPQNGVYATVSTTAEGETFTSVTNVGLKPTFKDSSAEANIPNVETHLFNFEGNLYGKLLTVEFRDRLRDEIRFESKEALVQQIQEDIRRAKEKLGSF